MNELLAYTLQHLALVAAATAIATVVGVCLGVVSYRYRKLRPIVLWTVDVIQTIPSLALLAILMVFFGLGNATLVVGLALYSLLPIVRNTHTGLTQVPAHLKDAARGMGMTRFQRIALVELPIAFPFVFAGAKIAVVTGLSVAVIGVLIGSGGLGYPIYRGIQTQNVGMILTGAVPVVVLAFIFDFAMTKVEKLLLPNRSEKETKQ